LKLLIDSNAFIWAYSRPMELSSAARQALADADNDRFVSIAALWEIAIKVSTRKLVLKDDVRRAMDHLALELLPITLPHARRVEHLPWLHRDPFDRMMIAQAMEDGLTIVTRDRSFDAYGVSLLKA